MEPAPAAVDPVRRGGGALALRCTNGRSADAEWLGVWWHSIRAMQGPWQVPRPVPPPPPCASAHSGCPPPRPTKRTPRPPPAPAATAPTQPPSPVGRQRRPQLAPAVQRRRGTQYRQPLGVVLQLQGACGLQLHQLQGRGAGGGWGGGERGPWGGGERGQWGGMRSVWGGMRSAAGRTQENWQAGPRVLSGWQAGPRELTRMHEAGPRVPQQESVPGACLPAGSRARAGTCPVPGSG